MCPCVHGLPILENTMTVRDSQAHRAHDVRLKPPIHHSAFTSSPHVSSQAFRHSLALGADLLELECVSGTLFF
jgi:hypothetical protein